MAQCTPQNVFDQVRGILNDNATAGGVVFTNTILQPFFAQAYRKMYDALDGMSLSLVRHTVYFTLPAYTQQWVPQANGITDMAEPELLYERSSMVSGNITSTDTSTPINVLTSGAHGLGSPGSIFSQDIIISGVANTMAPWGRWFATIVDPTHFSLNGSVSDGVAGSGGTYSYSSLQFIEMIETSYALDYAPGTSLSLWYWENNILQFRGASQPIQIRLVYIASGTAPTNVNTNMNIDNCLNFLATATAGYAAESRGWYQMADRQYQRAFGPKGEADASGGMLRDMIATAVLMMQGEVRTRRTFRSPRTALTPNYFG